MRSWSIGLASAELPMTQPEPSTDSDAPGVPEPARGAEDPGVTTGDAAGSHGSTDPADAPGTASPFAALGLGPEIVRALTALGYEEPTPIQRAAIPVLLAGRDLLGQAATGTGKTAAFALPLLQRVAGAALERNAPQALVLVPTRELAMQVAEAVHRYGKEQRASVLPIYGGQSIVQQLRALDRGVAIVVATPGRAIDHLQRGTMKLERVRMVVLDEADEMLDMGFAEELEAILSRLPEEHQTALFSATLPPRILGLAAAHLREPERIEIARERTAAGAVPRVRQVAYVVPRAHKPLALARVLDMEAPASAIVFCRTRIEVDELTDAMNAHGYRAEALHGGFAQEQRDRVMKRFRSSATDLLIATDVAARGLDIDHVTHVVNYDVPTAPDVYLHRIGRTGRMGREGVAITLIDAREQRLLKSFQRVTQQPIPIESIPSISDLRTRRLELTKAALREAVLAGDLDAFRSVVTELAGELDPADVAAAAVKLAHQASHAEGEAQAEEQDVLLRPAPRRERPQERGNAFGSGAPYRSTASQRGGHQRGTFGRRADRNFDGSQFGRSSGERSLGDRAQGDRAQGHAPRPGANARSPHAHGFGSARLFIGAGRLDNLRPGDLVGAIANEAGVPGHVVGSIQIADRFAIVEVPENLAEQIIQALRSTQIRGRRVNVRRDKAH
jgi:ATP-dependent RNA helicase DeaD